MTSKIENEHEDGDEEQNGEPIDGGLVGIVPGSGARLDLRRIAGQRQRDITHAVLDTAREIAGAEARQDRIVDDDPRQGIGEDRLQSVADFDTDLALVRRDDQEHAIVELLGADAPVPAELIAVVLDLVALQRWQRHHHHLIGALILELFQLLGERLLILRAQQIRVVDHAAGQRGKGWGGGNRKQRKAKRGDKRQNEDARRVRAQRHQGHEASLAGNGPAGARTLPSAPASSPRRRRSSASAPHQDRAAHATSAPGWCEARCCSP
jgi:hypothetical protein